MLEVRFPLKLLVEGRLGVVLTPDEERLGVLFIPEEGRLGRSEDERLPLK